MTDEAQSIITVSVPEADRILSYVREVPLLVPEDPSPFVRMTRAVVRRWPEYPDYSGQHPEIQPHVSLAYGNWEHGVP